MDALAEIPGILQSQICELPAYNGVDQPQICVFWPESYIMKLLGLLHEILHGDQKYT